MVLEIKKTKKTKKKTKTKKKEKQSIAIALRLRFSLGFSFQLESIAVRSEECMTNENVRSVVYFVGWNFVFVAFLFFFSLSLFNIVRILILSEQQLDCPSLSRCCRVYSNLISMCSFLENFQQLTEK